MWEYFAVCSENSFAVQMGQSQSKLFYGLVKYG